MKGNGFVSLNEALRDRRLAEGRPCAGNCIPSGIETLDDCAGGLRKGDLLIVAGGERAGKTSLALTLAHNIAARDFCGLLPPDPLGEAVAYFAPGMPSYRLAIRVLAIHTQVPLRSIERSTFTADQVARVRNAAADVGRLGLLFNTSNHNTVADLKQATKELHSRSRLRSIFVDQLQIPAGCRGSDLETVSCFLEGLKCLAMELGIPVVAVMSIPDWVPSRTYDTLDISELKRTGMLRHADVVLTVTSLHRQFHRFHPEPRSASRRWRKWRKVARHLDGNSLIEIYEREQYRASLFLRQDPATLRFLDLAPK